MPPIHYNHQLSDVVSVSQGSAGAQTVYQSLRAARMSILADSLSLKSLASFNLQGYMLTPSGLFALLGDPEIFYHAYVVSQKLPNVQMSESDPWAVVAEALDRILVELGIAMLDLTPGPYFAFVDPRYHLNSKQLIQRTRDLVGHFENSGIDRNRIVISIPSTEAGVRATWTLWNTDKINVNLTLVGGLAHATICAEAGAAYLSFDLGSLSKAYMIRGEGHLVLEPIQATVAYLNLHNLRTKVIVCDLPEAIHVQDLPDVHFVSVNSDQASRPQGPGKPTPSNTSPSSYEAYALALHPMDAKHVFKSRDEGCSDGKFLNTISAASRSVIFSVHTRGLKELEAAMGKLFMLIRDDVVKYRILTSRLATPEHGVDTLRSLALVKLTSLIEEKKDLNKAYHQWSTTSAGRMIESETKVHFMPTDVDENGNRLQCVHREECVLNGYNALIVRVPLHLVGGQPSQPAPGLSVFCGSSTWI